MDNQYRDSKQITEGYLQAGIVKANKEIYKLILLGILAGMFVAFGASSSMVAAHAVENYGTAKLVASVVFPVGLMLIILVGGELFTGDCLMILAVWDKKIGLWNMTKKLTIIFLSNLIGAILVVLLIKYSGQQDISGGALGAYTIKAAYLKVSLTPMQAFISGIGCNIIVCGAMLMAYSAVDTVGKVMGAFFPIMIFVIAGFEHCIANMYYIPAGILATMNPNYREQALSLYHLTEEKLATLTWSNFFINIGAVTAGNIIGGIFFIGLPLYLIHIYQKKK